MEVPAADVDTSWAKASDNASELEWAKARSELSVLAQRSMCAAEAGIRLYGILRRVPSLLTGELGSLITPEVEGGGRASSASRELLPLPPAGPGPLPVSLDKGKNRMLYYHTAV